ncbi:MAG: UbiA family prenyltransferase [Planctomycetota bacterium]
MPVLVAVAAARPPGQWDWGVLIASVLGVGLLHGAGNLLNDYFDFRSGVDRKVEGDEGRPGRLLVTGELKPADVLTEAIVCLLLVVPVGGYLLWECGAGLLWFAAAGGLGLYAYTGPPLKLKYRALGEVLIFIVLGPILMLGAAYAQTRQIEITVLLLSVPIGFATTAVLVGNNIRDLTEDSAADIKTLAHLAGPRVMRILYVLLLVGCVLVLGILGAAGILPRILVLTPVLLVLLWKPLGCVWRNERLPDIDARTAKFEAVLLVMLFLTFVLIRMPSESTN